jgi:hypothetical protein
MPLDARRFGLGFLLWSGLGCGGRAAPAAPGAAETKPAEPAWTYRAIVTAERVHAEGRADAAVLTVTVTKAHACRSASSPSALEWCDVKPARGVTVVLAGGWKFEGRTNDEGVARIEAARDDLQNGYENFKRDEIYSVTVDGNDAGTTTALVGLGKAFSEEGRAAKKAEAEAKKQAERDADIAAGQKEVAAGKCDPAHHAKLQLILKQTKDAMEDVQSAVALNRDPLILSSQEIFVASGNDVATMKTVLAGEYHVAVVSFAPFSMEVTDAKGNAVALASDRRGSIKAPGTYLATRLYQAATGTSWKLKIQGTGCTLWMAFYRS